MNVPPSGQPAFSASYSLARDRFVAAAESAGAEVDATTYPAVGPAGETLTTDVAWVGPRDAQNVLVTVSGTHGIEGFCGSAAQVDWLVRGESGRLPARTAALLIHAINPYGFAWLKRVTHENVDLNRNWIDFSSAVPANPDYTRLHSALCPEEWSIEAQASSIRELMSFAQTNGKRALVEAVSSGQYSHAQGLFHGGTSESFARRTLERVLAQYLAGARHIAIVDFHSGLGPWGYGELMVSAEAEGSSCTRAGAWYGAAVTPVGSKLSASPLIHGDWLSAAPRLLAQATVTGLALEFGTIDDLGVLNALRADNWLSRSPQAQSPGMNQEIANQMLAAFNPDSEIWRGMVLGQALAVCRQAIRGLASVQGVEQAVLTT